MIITRNNTSPFSKVNIGDYVYIVVDPKKSDLKTGGKCDTKFGILELLITDIHQGKNQEWLLEATNDFNPGIEFTLTKEDTYYYDINAATKEVVSRQIQEEEKEEQPLHLFENLNLNPENLDEGFKILSNLLSSFADIASDPNIQKKLKNLKVGE